MEKLDRGGVGTMWAWVVLGGVFDVCFRVCFCLEGGVMFLLGSVVFRGALCCVVLCCVVM